MTGTSGAQQGLARVARFLRGWQREGGPDARLNVLLDLCVRPCLTEAEAWGRLNVELHGAVRRWASVYGVSATSPGEKTEDRIIHKLLTLRGRLGVL